MVDDYVLRYSSEVQTLNADFEVEVSTVEVDSSESKL